MIDEKEMGLHAGLMKLLDEGTFELKAKEVPAFIQIYNWFKSLPDRKQPDLDKKEPPKQPKKTKKKSKKKV